MSEIHPGMRDALQKSGLSALMVPAAFGGRNDDVDPLAVCLVREVLSALRVATVDESGWEADDILATIAARAEADGHDVLIVTGDRDSYQLVHDPRIKVIYNRRGVSDYALYDEAGIAEKTGVDVTKCDPSLEHLLHTTDVKVLADELTRGLESVEPSTTTSRLVIE